MSLSLKKAVSVIVVLSILFSSAACVKKPQNPADPFAMKIKPNDYSYYPKTIMNADKRLYVFGDGYSRSQTLTGEAIQGLFAQTEIAFFRLNDSQDLGDRHAKVYLDDLIDTYGVNITEVSFEQMLTMYKQSFSDFGYILYKTDANGLGESVNVARTISGITGYIPVDADNTTVMEAVANAGIPQKLDVTDKTERWCFDNYKDMLNNDYLVQQKTNNPCLTDFGIANKLLFFYPDSLLPGAHMFRSEVHTWAKKEAPIFGWGPFEEDSHVGIASMYSQFTIPSDHCHNLTVMCARDFYGLNSFVPANNKEKLTAEADKHYVCLMRSDGDNVQTWFNFFPLSPNDMGAERGDFPMAWSIQPSLTDLAPNILDYVYRNAKPNDNFVAAVSGMGYMYPASYPLLTDFTGGLDVYLKRSGLSIVQILDGGFNNDVIESYSRVPSLKGVVYSFGDKYAGGKGSIRWSDNGKPFISFRESLWNTTPQQMAARINSFESSPTDIAGYSLINIHPWSQSYNDVKQMVELLNDNVIIVSPDQFFDLIIENVPKVDKNLS